MANSLKSKLSKLRHDRNISENMYNELLDKLDGHDRELSAKVIDKTCSKIYNYLLAEVECRVLVEDWHALAEEFKELAEQMKDG